MNKEKVIIVERPNQRTWPFVLVGAITGVFAAVSAICALEERRKPYPWDYVSVEEAEADLENELKLDDATTDVNSA